GNASLARLGCAPGAPALAHLEQIEAITVRAAELCKQMLAYAGKGRFTLAPLDLGAALDHLRELLKLSLSKKAQLVFDLAPDVPPALADAAQLRQVVLNLVGNAVEALGAGEGTVRVATRRARLGPGALRTEVVGAALAAGEYACLEVSDDGPGMS